MAPKYKSLSIFLLENVRACLEPINAKNEKTFDYVKKMERFRWHVFYFSRVPASTA